MKVLKLNILFVELAELTFTLFINNINITQRTQKKDPEKNKI